MSSGLFTFSGGPTDVNRTFEIPDLIENKYQFKFEIQASSTENVFHSTGYLRYDTLKTTVSHQDHLDFQVTFRADFDADDEDTPPNLVIREIVYTKSDDNDIDHTSKLLKWLICYSLKVMVNFRMVTPASIIEFGKIVAQIFKSFSNDLHIRSAQKTVAQLRDNCSTPLSYELVFDPSGTSNVTTIPLAKRFDIRQYPLASGAQPSRVIGRPSSYNPLVLHTTHTKYDGVFSRRFDIADLHLNEWFDARRTVVYQASNEKGPWKLGRIISHLVPVVSKWDAAELRQLLILFQHEDYNRDIPLQRFGEVNLEYQTNTNSLYLAFFYNYSTKHLSADQIQRYHRERWRGVMKQMLCAAIQFFLNDSGHYIDGDSAVRLAAVPFYHGDDDNLDYLAALQSYYTKNFGFLPVDRTAQMQTTVNEITRHCTESLSSFEDEVMPGQPIRQQQQQKSNKRKLDDMMNDAITQTQPTMLHPIAPTMPDKQTLDEFVDSVFVFLAETNIITEDDFDHDGGGGGGGSSIINNNINKKIPKTYIAEKQKRNKNAYDRITAYVLNRIVTRVCLDYFDFVVVPEQGTYLYAIWIAISRSNVLALLTIKAKQVRPTLEIINDVINNELTQEDQQTFKLELNDIFQSAMIVAANMD